MQVWLVVGAACVVALAVQALLAGRGAPRHPAPPAGPAGPPTAEQRAWQAGWRITASVVAARTLVLLLLGLTPLGGLVLVPIASAGETYATPLTLTVLGGLAWLPGRLARPARTRAFAHTPLLRPFRAEGGSPVATRLRVVLLAGIAVLLVVSQRSESETVALAAIVGYLVAVFVLVRMTRRLGLNRPVPLDDAVPPGEGIDRLTTLYASLDPAGTAASASAPALPPARLVVGRYRGRSVNAWATRLDRGWAVVVAPELLTRLRDDELRALLAHESGHLSVAGARRRQLAVVLMVMAAALLGLGLPYAIWERAIGWLVTGLSDLPAAYGTTLLTAMQLTVGYLVFVLLRPLVLVVHRADEAAADRRMLQLSADPRACTSFLAQQPEIFGVPYRWTPAQLLLVATHPSIGDRMAAVAAQAVGGRS